jgi:hypothetical protein
VVPQPHQADLAARGCQEVASADHEIDTVPHIINRHRKLVRPEAVPVAYQQIPALLRRILALRSIETVAKALVSRCHHHTQPAMIRRWEPQRATGARIPNLRLRRRLQGSGDGLSRAPARIDRHTIGQPVERLLVHFGNVALPEGRRAATSVESTVGR